MALRKASVQTMVAQCGFAYRRDIAFRSDTSITPFEEDDVDAFKPTNTFLAQPEEPEMKQCWVGHASSDH